MSEVISRRILDHVSDTRYQPRTLRELSRDLNIPDSEYDNFKQAVDQLLQEGLILLGAQDTLALPPPDRVMTGTFRKHERGFGFIYPDELTEHGELFIPQGNTLDAMTGDRVRAKVYRKRRRAYGPTRATRSPYIGRIIEVISRAERIYTGTVISRGSLMLVQVDGRMVHEPVVIRDPGAKQITAGDKVAIELVDYGGQFGELPEAVVTEVLGEAGRPDVETQAVIRSFGLNEKFSAESIDQARQAAETYQPEQRDPDRHDLTDMPVCTIDPPDARDFDDAISIRQLDDAQPSGWELGIHIADVSSFVATGTELDRQALERGNSVYLPRRVLPMLPELLSNGVCSLQEGVPRYCKSCFIRYDASGRITGSRICRSVIRSAKRLTYREAQALIDDDLRLARKHVAMGCEPKYGRELIHMLKMMDQLAKAIRSRRMRDGMIVLNLPKVDLIFDDSGRVVDAQPEDDSFTHTIIEMFMVEANEVVAELFHQLDVPMVRRVHADPNAYDMSELRQFARIAGYNIPVNPTRHELQDLLKAVEGKPAQYAVHLAVLKTLSKAEYSPAIIGHFALAGEHYTHFTSPIRRYPDLVVHRGLDAVLNAAAGMDLDTISAAGGRMKKKLAQAVRDDPVLHDEEQLREISRRCSFTERNAESAEQELRTYLVLELLEQNLGEDYEGTVTGVISAGLFIQLDKYLVEGFIRVNDLPGKSSQRWRLNPNTGALVAQGSGKTITIGDRYTVRIAKVDLQRRQLDLAIIEMKPDELDKKKKRRQSPGARRAHQRTQKLKAADRGEVTRKKKKKRR